MDRPHATTPSPRRHAATFVLVLLACFAPSLAHAQVPCGSNLPLNKRTLLVGGQYVEYYASYELTAYNAQVKRAVFLLHGYEGDYTESYYALTGSACVAERLGWAPEAPRRRS